MKNDRTKTIFYPNLKHVHKYGSAKFQPNPLFFFTTNGHRTCRRKKKKKKSANPLGISPERDAPITLRFALRTTVLELKAILRWMHWMTPKALTLKSLKGHRYPVYCLPLHQVPYFIPLHSMDSRCRVTEHFETSALNDPKMTLNAKTSKLIHTHILTTPPPRLPNVILWRAIFELQAILRQVQWMTGKWH